MTDLLESARAVLSESPRIQDRLESEFEGVELRMREIDDGLVELSKIVVPEDRRGEGLGTEVMEALTGWADREGVTLATTPSDAYGGDRSQLREFYRGFGFAPNEGARKVYKTREAMIRPPGGA